MRTSSVDAWKAGSTDKRRATSARCNTSKAADDAAWERARGWAAHFAVVYLAHSDDDPIMERIGTDLFTTLLAL